MDLKLPSQRLESAGTLVLYGIMAGEGRFYRVFVLGNLGEIKYFYIIAAYRLRHWKSKVEYPI